MIIKLIFPILFLLFLLGILLIILNKIIKFSTLKRKDSAKAIECGFESKNQALRIPYSSYFLSVIILFLIFDVETVILFPAPFILRDKIIRNRVGTLFFLFVILIGLMYEINQGIIK